MKISLIGLRQTAQNYHKWLYEANRPKIHDKK